MTKPKAKKATEPQPVEPVEDPFAPEDPFADEGESGSLALYFVYEKEGQAQKPLARLAYTHAGSEKASKKLSHEIAQLLTSIFAKMESMKTGGEPLVVLPAGEMDWKKDA